ncbi:hypothetical protein [Roseicella aquatilis]|uniref:Uncharacterized protein n=1 Tax=Roseicella aquatilis TaxID=2527868 RepID=A0A4R4D7Z2_9PROT|nr:hypothetical protein [Roseicella aquatilis]TCZ55945.1 hypothetical protein EXY23_20315 [Roseicella aquatilis]
MLSDVTGHIGRNLWLWTAIGLAVAALATWASSSLGNGYYLAEIGTLAAMFAGTTLILISQQGTPRQPGPEA